MLKKYYRFVQNFNIFSCNEILVIFVMIKTSNNIMMSIDYERYYHNVAPDLEIIIFRSDSNAC